jgi:hypothetical protein
MSHITSLVEFGNSGGNGVHTPTPTEQTYVPLLEAFNHFNRALFAGALPNCLITLQRDSKGYGYFHANKFAAIGSDAKADEIALNPAHFRVRTPKDTCSTLIHEMCHLWQAHFGKPSRAGYHNQEWATAMRAIGLEPSSTGAAGGKSTGYTVSHLIIDDGPFDLAFRAFEASGWTVGWGDPFTRGDDARKPAKKRHTYICPGCGLNALCVPNVKKLGCRECDLVMVAREVLPDGEARHEAGRSQAARPWGAPRRSQAHFVARRI